MFGFRVIFGFTNEFMAPQLIKIKRTSGFFKNNFVCYKNRDYKIFWKFPCLIIHFHLRLCHILFWAIANYKTHCKNLKSIFRNFSILFCEKNHRETKWEMSPLLHVGQKCTFSPFSFGWVGCWSSGQLVSQHEHTIPLTLGRCMHSKIITC